jgi:hypothetical protein
MLSHTTRLLLACLSQVDFNNASSSTAVECACDTAAQLYELALLVPTQHTAAIVMHASDLMLLTMLRITAASDMLVTLEVTATAGDPLPGQAATLATPEKSPAIDQPAQKLLAAAVKLLASVAGLPVLQAQDAVARIAAFCTSGMALLARPSAVACADVLKSLPAISAATAAPRGLATAFSDAVGEARHPAASEKAAASLKADAVGQQPVRPAAAEKTATSEKADVAGTSGQQLLRDAAAAAKASACMLQEAVVKAPRQTRLHTNAAWALLKELLQVIGTANKAKGAKVLVSAGACLPVTVH